MVNRKSFIIPHGGILMNFLNSNLFRDNDDFLGLLL